MQAVPSANFLKEFTLIANIANDEDETFVIQRANGKNVVLMSMDKFNAMQKELYLANKER